MKKYLLPGWIVAVIVAFVAFRLYDGPPPPRFDPVAVVVVGTIGAAMLAASVIMLALTQTWTARGLGLVSVMLGVMVYGIGTFVLTVVPSTQTWGADIVNDAILALWTVGAPMLLYGIGRYLNSAIFPEGDAQDYWDGGGI